MRQTASWAILVTAVVAWLVSARTHHAPIVVTRVAAAPQLDAQARARTFTFDPAMSTLDRQWFLGSVARARPEARALIAQVDGLVTVTTTGPGSATTAGGAHLMGTTLTTPSGYTVWLNAGELDGERAIDRPTVVLHELGHVVDSALVPEDLDRRLDAGIPRGGTCVRDGFDRGSCAATRERFADTFAKWALNGAVSAVGSGYGVPLPPSLETWGEPLAALALRGA